MTPASPARSIWADEQPFACDMCDHRRASETTYCADCGEVTGSYAWSDADESEFAYGQRLASGHYRVVPGFGFHREASSGLIFIEGEVA